MKQLSFFAATLSLICSLHSFSSNAQDAKWAKEVYNQYLKNGKNYSVRYENTKEVYRTVRFMEETGKFPNYKKINSLKEKVSILWDKYARIYSKQEFDKYEKNYDKIVQLYSELIEQDKFNLEWYYELSEFYIFISLCENISVPVGLTKNENYLQPLSKLYSTMKTNFDYFRDDVYQKIIKDYYKISKYEECYSECIEYQSKNQNYYALGEEIKSDDLIKNELSIFHTKLENIVFLSSLEFKLGKINQSYERLENTKATMLSKKFDFSNFLRYNNYNGFIKLFDLVSYRVNYSHPLSTTLFSSYSKNKKFIDNKIDFDTPSNIIPINNFSSRIQFLKAHKELDLNINNSFDLFLKRGWSDNDMSSNFWYPKYMWPSFSAINTINTPELFSYLVDQKDIQLLLENKYIDNIIDFENINGNIKVYYLANREQNVIGVFELPKNAAGFSNIQINYYSFNYVFESSTTYRIGRIDYEVIKNIEYSKLENVKLANLNLPLSLNCDKIAQLKRKEEQEKRDKDNARIAEEKRQEQLRIAEEKRLEQLRIAEEKKQEQLRIAEEKKSEQTRIAEESKIYELSQADFSDNGGQYIGKIIIVPAFYSNAGNAGAWSDIGDMTLRSQGDVFEDSYSVLNFSYTLSDGASKNYRRRATIDGRKINLIIPKNLSDKMPNTESSLIWIKGKVVNYNTIEVRQIERRD
jgi:hypothetical protein